MKRAKPRKHSVARIRMFMNVGAVFGLAGLVVAFWNLIGYRGSDPVLAAACLSSAVLGACISVPAFAALLRARRNRP